VERSLALERHEAALTAEAVGAFCRVALAGVAGGSFVSFDDELRVRFAEGLPLLRAAVGPMVGRRLPDVVPAASWEVLRGPYEAAIAGRTTRFDVAWEDSVFSVHVAPFVLPGGDPGALAVSHTVSLQRPPRTSLVEQTDGVAGSEELFRAVFDSVPVGITVVDSDGRWLRVNREGCRMLGYDREELIGAAFEDFTHPDDIEFGRRELAAAFTSDAASPEREKRYLHKDGSVVWVHARSERVRDETGKTLYLVVHLHDITERRVAQAHRRESDRRLHAIIDESPAVISVKGRDQRYELVNREFQEWCGLPVEQIVGRSAKEMTSGPVFEDGSAKDQLVLDGAGPTQDEDSLVREGHQRVYLTSRFPLLDDAGQVSAVCCSSVDITERRDEERARRERLESEVLIREALAQDRLILQGQPIINLASMQIEQAELLIRMQRTTDSNELVPPGEFLPAAERFGHIGLIDDWVVDQAVYHAGAGHRVEVNLSSQTISDVSQVDRIEQAVLLSGCPPANLIFEITETAIAEHLDAAHEFAVRLRTLGCSFALDDFGVGHGTFTYLKHLEVDYLKIDLQFVRDLLKDDSDRQVVEAIIGVAKQYGIKTIAEGVEDRATLEELQRMGADYAQGYWIGRPAPFHELWNLTVGQEQT
jgi:PAS domain S-box-containing protein